MSEHVTEHKHGGLGELPATAICGNDITSSCLYVSALAITFAGKYAWLSLLMVAAVLFLFRKIYGEVVGALPLNGGAYNALLNTTSKRVASLAACLTLLSYMATAVISGLEAMHYVEQFWHDMPVLAATCVLLAAFALLTSMGIGESSTVAIGIFVLHMASLALLALVAGIYIAVHGLEVLRFNMALPVEGGIGRALFFGFAASMLGISGFESSSNFVEEQAEGVFPKTLRNMWIAVSVFNPLMAILALALVRIPDVETHQTALLAHMGSVAGGSWLAHLISIDASLVLSGAVLTSFVGVSGLLRRMTLDRVLPQFLLKVNRRGTSHRIIIAFFLLCLSVLWITKGNVFTLAGVYTISFLAVMSLFGIGNILLKVRRARLPRPERASWPAVLVAIAAVVTGIAGNLLLNPEYAKIFFAYFVPALLIVMIMLGRIGILKTVLFFMRSISDAVARFTGKVSTTVVGKIEAINSQQMVFFTRGDDLATLNQAMLYVRNNEHTDRVKVVFVGEDESSVPDRLEKDLAVLDEVYPRIDIEFVFVHGKFSPELVRQLSDEWDIPMNFMFIGAPSDHFMYGLAELGGVRLIV
ncbi:MAG: APC family permease [Acidobacteriota bacterium]|nr:APC family permease [Acidobacteriota bacterium]MDH3523622.1 APC family permease [Acidobacteriota bacterium]